MLYSREFLAAARAHLRPGGVHLQWFHDYETDSRTVEMVLSAYAAAFDHVSVWHVGQDLLLLGQQRSDVAQNLQRITARMRQPAFAAAFAKMSIDQPIALLGHELLPVGVVHALDLPAANHTLMHPRLNHAAARAFFVGGSGRLPRIPGSDVAQIAEHNSLLGRYIAARDGHVPGRERSALVREACAYRTDLCATLLAWWQHEQPHAPGLDNARRQIRRRMGPRSANNPLDRIDSLVRLYQASPTSATYDEARRSLETFVAYYHPAVPFPVGAVAAALQRCPATDAVRCDALRASAKPWIGARSR
jgi:hypothetical protein